MNEEKRKKLDRDQVDLAVYRKEFDDLCVFCDGLRRRLYRLAEFPVEGVRYMTWSAFRYTLFALIYGFQAIAEDLVNIIVKEGGEDAL